MMKRIIALETATEACSVALEHDGKLFQRFAHSPQQQANLILPMIDSVLQEACLQPGDLDAIAYGRGPGSFTGLRIAAAVAQGIAIAANLPVIPVSTLAVLAQGIYREYGHTAVFAAIDARMQEVYCGSYVLAESGLMILQGEEQVLPPGQTPVSLSDDGWVGAGSGWRAYGEVLQTRLQINTVYPEFWPQAAHMLELAQTLMVQGYTVDAAEAAPVYLRNNVAQPKVTP